MSGDKYVITDQQGCYFVTFTVIQWIDLFSRRQYRDIIVDSLNYCIAVKGLVVYGWVIMSNHIHLIITTKGEKENISEIIRDFKKHTSRKIVLEMKLINESRKEWILHSMSSEAKRVGRANLYKLWRDDNHAIRIDNVIIKIDVRLNYIHENPVRNGLVANAWEYLYSSAIDYELDRKGFVNIEYAL
jgi:putative transposase